MQLCGCKTCLITHSYSGSPQWVLDLEHVCGGQIPAWLGMEGTRPAEVQAEVAGMHNQSHLLCEDRNGTSPGAISWLHASAVSL